MQKDLKHSRLYEEAYNIEERSSILRLLTLLLAVILFVVSFRMYWENTFSGVVVSGRSMETTLLDKDKLLLKKTPDGKGAKRGEVIVVYIADYPEVQWHNQNTTTPVEFLIKRLIAVEGDSVYCVDGQIYIKYKGETEFVRLDEPYAYYETQSLKKTYDFGVYEVGKGEVFFLGDNRLHSQDSRYKEGLSHLSGRLYKQEDIIGVVPEWAIDNRVILEKIFF